MSKKKKAITNTFLLSLHFKQGDDFGAHLDELKTPSLAFAKWGEDFKRRAAICEQLARALEGKAVDIDADVHMILITAEDQAAQQALQALEKEGILSPSPWED